MKTLKKIAKVFKKWPSTYEWTATISIKNDQFFMKSQWNRICK